jgi:hypothetical protein
MTELPTIKELMEKVGVVRISCGYGETRTIVNHLDRKSVLSYGLGLGGFVVVWKDLNGFPHANSYFVKNPFSGYPDGGFREMEVADALNVITTNKLVVEKGTDEKELETSLKKKKYARPEVGEMLLDYGNYNYLYKVSLYKNGKYCIEKWYCDSNRPRWKNSTNVRELLAEYSKAKTKKKKHKWDEIPEIKNNTIPKKDLERMQMFIMTEEV